MASFDVVSKVDMQTLDNAVNVAVKEITTRYDLKNSKTVVELDKKAPAIRVETDNEMSLRSIEDILVSRIIKQGLDGRCIDFSVEPEQAGTRLKKDLKVRQGLDKEQQRKVLKIIKDNAPKVTAQMMDDQIRVTSKKIDELQAVIAVLRRMVQEFPLQFVNMKS
ncbi:YajQ family cyclic di-GMP-binding protein [Tellurirhabdus rosea]|uniref:YajQ family cyclic di-GMP-binding protein n=1 Tax=Tellurirhabdus rosea TaxID=2674997 RepID=UPI0022517A91|nr:YajQ family cyclic di-GMP-binding protein [Tellurirhabdus rosea]